jgi:hypothetical protein
MPANTKTLLSRWGQSGSIWRQWLLLEPLLLQLQTPLPCQGTDLLLLSRLRDITQRLQSPTTLEPLPSDRNEAQLWLD